MIAIGAPPHEAAKYEGYHNALPHSFFATIGYCFWRIMLPVEFRQLSLKVKTDPIEDRAQLINHLFGEHAPAVFSNEDQMHMHLENTVPAMPNLIVFLHRQNIIEA